LSIDKEHLVSEKENLVADKVLLVFDTVKQVGEKVLLVDRQGEPCRSTRSTMSIDKEVLVCD
jgi:hypothetical protein